jgi:UDP-N-acetylglucosamine--N-acetylmuramyl-(pentapeptide) pyrophosphoryl-undecaprenol N-acetylglucosamine transferase
MTDTWVSTHVPALLADPQALARMSTAASTLVPRDAADRLAALIAQVADAHAGKDAS